MGWILDALTTAGSIAGSIRPLLDLWPWIAGLLGVGGAGFTILRFVPGLGSVLTWLPWAIAGLAVIGFGIDDVRLRFKVSGLELAAADTAKKQAEAVAAAEAEVRRKMSADVELGGRLAGEYVAETAKLQGDLQDALVRLAHAQRRPECDHTPAADAFDNWLRDSDPTGQPAAVPRPDRRPGAQSPVPARRTGPRRVP